MREFLHKYRQTDKYRQYKEEYLKSPAYRWNCVKVSASQRDLVLSLTREDVESMCMQPCHYCGDDPQVVGVLFGLDRVENEGGYTKDNVVTCCSFCNYAKSDHHVDDFLRIMCNVGATILDDTTWAYNYSFTDTSKQKNPSAFSTYTCRARDREMEFHLTKDEFDKITAEPCFYCQRPAPSGVDRIDNHLGYEASNVVSACSACNYAKRDWDVDTFWTKAKTIFLKWRG